MCAFIFKQTKYDPVNLSEAKQIFFEKWNAPPIMDVTLDDFERIVTLGTGNFGRVMLAKHKDTNGYFMKISSKTVDFIAWVQNLTLYHLPSLCMQQSLQFTIIFR